MVRRYRKQFEGHILCVLHQGQGLMSDMNFKATLKKHDKLSCQA